jgi:hypothetical protein
MRLCLGTVRVRMRVDVVRATERVRVLPPALGHRRERVGV